jgi:methionine aminotransferase
VIPIRTKLPNIGMSIFPIMTALAKQHGAVNLAQGFPGFSADEELLHLINQYTSKGFNQYAPLMGYIPLREKLSEKIEQQHQKYYHPEKEICITAGATQAIYTAITAIIEEGDEVIVIEPAYDCYVPAIILNQGIPVRSQLKPITYEIDWEDIKRKINSRTKAILINTPHNPTGKVWKQSDIDELIKIVRNSNIFLISDEVYEHITFDGLPHLSVSKYPELAERAFVIYSFGKTYHLTGWRTGYVVAPEFMMKEFVQSHQYMVYAVNTPLQYALADYSLNTDAYTKLSAFFEQKRNAFIQSIQSSSFGILPCEGTYFLLLDYQKLSDAKDTDYANFLTQQYKIASIPTSVFYGNKRQDKVLRVCFAKSDEELEKGAEALCKVLAQ